MAVDLVRAQEIPGWMQLAELQWLAEQAQQAQSIVEIGSWKGRSTRALGDHCRGTVYVVDDWILPKEAQDQTNHELVVRGRADIIKEWRANLRDLLASHRVVLVRGDSSTTGAKVAKRLQGGAADLVFIDADHSYNGVMLDILAYEPLVRDGGILAGHDYGQRSHPGVRQAVDEVFADRVQRGPRSIWWVRVERGQA